MSPGCSSKEPKSTVCFSSLGGVPVLSLPVFKFKLLKKSSSPDDFFSLMIFTNNDGNNIVARVFAPLSGIVEDAATGSACGALGALLASRNNLQTGKINFEINQGESIGRPSYINVNVIKEQGEVIKTSVSGKCVLVSEGTFYI